MSNMPSIEQIESVASRIKVMKPAVAKHDNLNDQMKLNDCLSSPDFVAEEKIDGIHGFMVANRFYSRDHSDKTANVPHLHQIFTELGMPNIVLDGEVYYEGKTSQYVTRASNSSPEVGIAFQKENGWLKYKIFDILRAPNGTWLVNKPYTVRRRMLEFFYKEYIEGTPYAEHIILVKKVEKQKKEFLDEQIASGAEGIVLKRKDSIYQFGKKPKWQWMKVKQTADIDLIITGYNKPNVLYTGGNFTAWKYWAEIDGVERPVTKPYYMGWAGSLQMSAYKNGELVWVCDAAGLKEDFLKQIKEDPNQFIGKVARIRFMEYTPDNNLRHPNFVNLHEDKLPEDCIVDEDNRQAN